MSSGSTNAVERVDAIVAAKRRNPEANTTASEREVDRLVYELYALTPAEVKVVDDGPAPKAATVGRH